MAEKTARRNGGVRTLGPVSELERHLPAEWWRDLFQSLYLKTDGDVVDSAGKADLLAHIADHAAPGDLAITAAIPLAAILVEKGVLTKEEFVEKLREVHKEYMQQKQDAQSGEQDQQ